MSDTPIYGENSSPAGGSTVVTIPEPLIVEPQSEIHQAVHNGTAYDEVIEIYDVAKNGIVDIFITVGANYTFIQGVKVFCSQGNLRATILEDVIVSDNGTAQLEAVCRNRDLRSTPTTLFYINPTITDPGTSIYEQWVPPTDSGAGADGFRISSGAEDQFLLRANTNYIMRLNNQCKTNIDIFFEMSWSEEASY